MQAKVFVSVSVRVRVIAQVFSIANQANESNTVQLH